MPSVVLRQVRVVGPSFNQGQPGSVIIELDSQGNENAIGFSLNFDTSKLGFVSAVVGGGITNATFNVNTLQVGSGRLGLALGFSSGITFLAGTRQLAVITFAALPTASGSTAIGFGDVPIGRETSDLLAEVLETDYPLTPTQFLINVQPNPVPTLSGVTPISAIAGSSGGPLVITGTNFVTNSVVKFGGSDLVTSYVNSTQLTAQLPAGSIGTAGNTSVTVFNPAPAGGTSSALNFTINNPAPAITNLSLASAIVGGAAFDLTVNGSNFVNGSVVKWNGSNRTTGFVSSTQLTAALSAADLATAGNFQVMVANPAPGGGDSAALNFAVNNPAPTLSNVAPTSAIVGGAAFDLTVQGSNFINGSVVKINGGNRTTSFINSTQLTAQVRDTDIATVGSLTVTVESPAPGGGPSSALTVSVENPAPVLSSLSPANVTVGGDAFPLIVNGSNFVNGSVVQFNSSNRTTSFVSSTQLTAQITLADLATAGAFAIRVVSPAPGGGPSSVVNLNVNNPPPTIANLDPANVTVGAEAFSLTVIGSNFISGAVVKVNGNERTTGFVSSSQLTAALSAADLAVAGIFPVLVVNPAPGGGSSAAATFTVNNPAPILASLGTASTIVGGAAFDLTVNGSNFVNGSVVKWNGSNRTTGFVSSTQLTAALSAADLAAAGNFSLMVANPAPGGGDSAALNFAVNNPAPSLSNVAPTSAIVGGATFDLTVNGSNFINGSVVKINGSHRATGFIDSTHLTAQVLGTDIGTVGSLIVMVENPAPGGGPSSALNVSVENPAPVLSSLLPANVTVGGDAFPLIVNGSNFVSGSVVQLEGNERTTAFVSSTQLTAQITLADLATAGAFAITVVSPAPGGGTSNVVNLDINNPPPTIANLDPANVTAGAEAFSLTVNGSNFISGAVVKFNGSERTTGFVSSSQLTAALSAADLAAAGNFPVLVINPAPGGGSSAAANFTVNNPAPILASLGTTSTIVGGAAFDLTVNGSNFVNGSVVKWNGSNRTTGFVSSTQLTAALSAADLAAAGTFQVMVANPTPGGGDSTTLDFAVNNPAPTISNLTPISAIVGGAAFDLTVNGNNFVSGAVVKINGSDRVTTFVSSSQLTAQITAADIQSTATSLISVFNPGPGGGASGNLDFSVINPVPSLSSLAPASANLGGADFTLIVHGTGFVNGAVVKFNDSDRITSFVSATQLTLAITAADLAAGGDFPVMVANPAPGGGNSSTVNFTVNNPAPTISNLSTTSAVAGDPAFILLVNGSNFVNGSVVRFEGNDHAASFVSATQLTTQITAADLQNAGTFQITVFNPAPGGGSSNVIIFNVIGPNPVPVIGGLTPAIMTAGGDAFPLTVNGTGFVNASVVKLEGNDRTTTFISSTQLTAQITLADRATAGVFAITVVSPGPGGGISNTVNLNVNNPTPTIANLDPANVTVGAEALSLTVNGSNFISGAVVKFNGSERTTGFVSSTQLTAAINAADLAAAGNFPVLVVNPAPGGGSSPSANLTVNNPAPILDSLAPASTIVGGAAFDLTVNGSNFVIGSLVKWNGSNRPTNFVGSTLITAQISAADIQSAGNASVSVFNPGPGGGASTAGNFTLNNPLPVLNSISPTSVTAGAGSFTLTATGTNFVTGSVVLLNGSTRPTTFVSATLLTAQISAAEISISGALSVTVFNPTPAGGTSNPLSLPVEPAPPSARALRVVEVTTIPGGTVNVSIELVSHGDENAVGFSLQFDPTQLTFVSAAKGADATIASLLVNSTAAIGHIGVAESLPAEVTFPSGVRQILTCTFTVPSTGNLSSTEISFGDFPILREVVTINAVPLATAYSAGVVNIAQGYEADIDNDGTIEIADWAQTGRFMALLDIVTPGAEFQRTDCSPAETRGDGRLSVADWTQAGRYAADLDPLTFAAGPTGIVAGNPAAQKRTPIANKEGIQSESVVRISEGELGSGPGSSLSIELDAQGNENALGFSLMFNPAAVSFVSAEKGRDAGEAVLLVNTINNGKGRVGIALAMPADRTFAPGRQLVAKMNFVIRPNMEDAMALQFSDLPIDRELVDVRANPIQVTFVKEQADERNPIEDAQYYIHQHYLDFLGRKPDIGGLDYWTEQITNCGSDAACIRERRINVSAAFFVEQEFQQTGNFIYRLYKGILGRQPTYQEFNAERRHVGDVSNYEVGKQKLVESWLERAEFQSKYPLGLSDEQFVDALLHTVQQASGVDLSGERGRLIESISNHNRAGAVRLVVENPDLYRAEYNPSFVLSEYFGYLRRDPDKEGYEFWLNVLNNRVPNNYRAMVCAFITSREYQQRFGPAITRTNAECGP